MIKIPTLEELLKAGVHFGHNKSKWHPKMAPYLYTEKNKVHIFNLEKTQEQLKIALNFVKETVANGGTVLFLGTKKQAKELVKAAAQKCGMPYIISRWLGGTFTNSKSVLGLVKNYKKLKAEKETSKWKLFTKRERLKFDRKIEKLEPLIGGIENLNKLPEVLFIVDIKNEKTAVLEANKVKIPVVAVCDSNVNPLRVQQVIPGNDDAVKSIYLLSNLVADAVLAGQAEKKEVSPAQEIKKDTKEAVKAVEKK
jgi:small subunit ribosomal protein S2